MNKRLVILTPVIKGRIADKNINMLRRKVDALHYKINVYKEKFKD